MMKCVNPGINYNSWRKVARILLVENIPPSEVVWLNEIGLFSEESQNKKVPIYRVKVPSAFVKLAENVSCHCDTSRWALMYRILWRIVCDGEQNLLSIACDEDVAKARSWERNVCREVHKMHAFVRFKLIDTPVETGRERYAAWFEPDHFIIEKATPFFKKRFANMDWSIFTPKGCAHWDGTNLVFSHGISNNPVECPDALEAAWLVYYRSIFNPARLKVKAMQTEMPKRYWKNLPEADLIEELVRESKGRVTKMLKEEPRPVKLQPKNAYLDSLRNLTTEVNKIPTEDV